VLEQSFCGIFKITPSYKLIRGPVSSFDEEDNDLTLIADEKAVLTTTVATIQTFQFKGWH